MQTAQSDAPPGRADSDDSDRTVVPSDPSPYFLEDAGAIPLVVEPQTIDHFILEEEDDEDIYRGEEPDTPRSPSPDSVTSSSSSSSSSSILGGRLGALSAVVEHAIATWARAWASSSSLSTTSSSSQSSIVTMTRSQMSRRQKRRLSNADLHYQRSAREIAARIRAREESRYIPRAFDLYVPNYLGIAEAVLEGGPITGPDDQRKHFLHTDSLSLIISQLGAALKDIGRRRRARSEAVTPEPSCSVSPFLHHSYMMPERPTEVSSSSGHEEAYLRRKARKGKRRVTEPQTSMHVARIPSSGSEPYYAEKAWWLDVSSPTWEDMRAIGKLLHLHPLTLEDILLQDPREKLELFPKLGYYFIVFRAIESQKTRERLRALGSSRDGSSPSEEGIVGEVNVYLLVFREGICSFHFADIGEHVDHVRNKILQFSESVNMSSDWIAHGIMDSIVDSFFPFLEGIEREVDGIETLVDSDHPEGPAYDNIPAVSLEKVTAHDSTEKIEMSIISTMSEINQELFKPTKRQTQFSLPARWPLFFRRLKRSLRETISVLRVIFKHTPTVTTTKTVHRMARTRRLVTSLARFLAHKSEVVTQLQKRLMTVDLDVYIYMGDVQDHILTLQQSLAHYERVLSQAHPTYLSHLRLAVSKAQSGTDMALVTLSTVSLGVLCIQTLIGLVSMNIKIPENSHTGNRYYVFGIVIALSVVISAIYLFFVRLWWVRAKKKRRAKF